MFCFLLVLFKSLENFSFTDTTPCNKSYAIVVIRHRSYIINKLLEKIKGESKDVKKTKRDSHVLAQKG